MKLWRLELRHFGDNAYECIGSSDLTKLFHNIPDDCRITGIALVDNGVIIKKYDLNDPEFMRILKLSEV